MHATPSRSVVVDMNIISTPPPISSQRSSGSVLRRSQPWTPAASAQMPIRAVAQTQATSSQSPPVGTRSSRPTPAGSSTNMNGTTNAGITYFQDWRVVR